MNISKVFAVLRIWGVIGMPIFLHAREKGWSKSVSLFASVILVLILSEAIVDLCKEPE